MADADGYIIYRAEEGAEFILLGTASSPDYIDTGTVAGNKYSYRVAGFNYHEMGLFDAADFAVPSDTVHNPQNPGGSGDKPIEGVFKGYFTNPDYSDPTVFLSSGPQTAMGDNLRQLGIEGLIQEFITGMKTAKFSTIFLRVERLFILEQHQTVAWDSNTQLLDRLYIR